MTANEVYKVVLNFINNDFAHHVEKQDEDVRSYRRSITWLFITMIAGMLGIIGTLIALVLGK